MQGALGISPAGIEFGQVTIGDTAPAQSVTVSNIGTSDLDIAAIDAVDASFIAAGGTCGALPLAGVGDVGRRKPRR